MGLPEEILSSHFELSQGCVLQMWRGSIAHGMYLPTDNPSSIDDKDVMSVYMTPIEGYFGLKQYGSRGTKEIKEGQWDVVCYELRKFVSLLKKGNPNVISGLWLEPNHYLLRHPCVEPLLANRSLFNSKQIYHSFSGYAFAQLKKMTHLAFEGYMGEKRKALVQKFGYDTKNAAHLVRLLRMAIEFLNEGVFYVQRRDANQLMEIKLGHWSLEQVQSEADRLFKRAEDAYDKSSLPTDVDHYMIDQVLLTIFKDFFGWKS